MDRKKIIAFAIVLGIVLLSAWFLIKTPTKSDISPGINQDSVLNSKPASSSNTKTIEATATPVVETPITKPSVQPSFTAQEYSFDAFVTAVGPESQATVSVSTNYKGSVSGTAVIYIGKCLYTPKIKQKYIFTVKSTPVVSEYVCVDVSRYPSGDF